MSDIWAYPYRLGIILFLIGGTVFLTAAFVGFAIWLERSFKKETLKK